MRGAQNRLSRHVLMAPMDAALMRNVEATVYPWIGGTWKSAIDFEGGSVGFFVLIDERVVSLCFSVFVSDGCHAIDMLTIEKFRGLGLAKAVASAFMDECVHRCLKPTWDCYEHNLPSRGLAQVLGFGQKMSSLCIHANEQFGDFLATFPAGERPLSGRWNVGFGFVAADHRCRLTGNPIDFQSTVVHDRLLTLHGRRSSGIR